MYNSSESRDDSEQLCEQRLERGVRNARMLLRVSVLPPLKYNFISII